MKPLVIGSRASRLALAQSEEIASRIRQVRPDLDVSIVKITTAGDRNRKTPLDQIPDIGFFVKELEEALIGKRIDLAVHSLKDMPTEIRSGLRIGAVPEREDPRDVLISRSGTLADLPAGSKVGTSSIRRAIQVAAVRPDLDLQNLRGNVDTRLRKVDSGEFTAIVMAAAALVRLGWQERITEYLSLNDFLPPAGQGALALEIREGDTTTAELVAPLNHTPTWQSVAAERAFLQALGGGCRAPIGALANVSGSNLELHGMVADPAAKQIFRSSIIGEAASPKQVGVALAELMLSQGAAQIISKVRSSEIR